MKVGIFHIDRGSEFKNKTLYELLEGFKIKRSLSEKDCPYDNAIAEATCKRIKTEFSFHHIFESQETLDLERFHYVHWYNIKHLHANFVDVPPCDYVG